uniref:Uncharacterized protein n=1 Tax=Trichuris muris TaxID=70415 RepID=A0A5S6QBP2_TRIMR
MFPPNLWSVSHCVLNGFPRTQNNMEMKFEKSSGTLKTAVNESDEGSRRLKEDGRIRKEEKLVEIINDRVSRPAIMDYLSAIAYNPPT